MRRDVRLLGDMLGEVLRESGGQDLLDDVERLRQAVIAARVEPRSRRGGPGDRRQASGPGRSVVRVSAARSSQADGAGPAAACAAAARFRAASVAATTAVSAASSSAVG